MALRQALPRALAPAAACQPPRHGIQSACPAQPRRRGRPAQAAAEDDGVRALLRRDRKELDLDAAEAAFQDQPQQQAAAAASVPPATPPQPAEPGRQPQAQASAPAAAAAPDGPRTVGEAIEAGVQRLRGGDAAGAVQLFQRALELPGRGAYRMSGSPKEYSCASEGEEQAALVNLACAYCALGQREAALASLEGAIEAGFSDFDTLRRDPDLQLLQGPGLELLLVRRQGQGLLAGLNPFGKKRR